MASISRSDKVRIHNRSRVLSVLRNGSGAISRAEIGERTGLSAATVSVITGDLIAQNLLSDLGEARDEGEGKSRGRPVARIGFNRAAGYAILIELDVNRCRASLVDYSGTLVDRIEMPSDTGDEGMGEPARVLVAQVERLRRRNAEIETRILRLAVSLQGILDRGRTRVIWSPVKGLIGIDLAGTLERQVRLPVALHKRGVLLASGIRRIYPELRRKSVATVFVGSTVAMGISHAGGANDQGTEFGHMNHVPEGALCRCGMRGCVEAYAADYGVLRTAFGVPEKTPPAPAVPPRQYEELIERARRGDRRAVHAFNVAGRALGYGLNRLLTVFDPDHIVIVGPGSEAIELMRPELEQGLRASIVARVKGCPEITTHGDESEPIFRGLLIETLTDIDQTEFATLPMPEGRQR